MFRKESNEKQDAFKINLLCHYVSSRFGLGFKAVVSVDINKR